MKFRAGEQARNATEGVPYRATSGHIELDMPHLPMQYRLPAVRRKI